MTLYHGSYMAIPSPDVLHSRQRVDFGRGFYTTPLREQAMKWVERFKRRGQPGVLSVYSFDESCLSQLDVLRFEDYSREWLRFVLDCRNGADRSAHDIVWGGIANDKVFNTVELFFSNLITEEEALGRLRFEKPNVQVCFRTQFVLDNHLHFERGESV